MQKDLTIFLLSNVTFPLSSDKEFRSKLFLWNNQGSLNIYILTNLYPIGRLWGHGTWNSWLKNYIFSCHTTYIRAKICGNGRWIRGFRIPFTTKNTEWFEGKVFKTDFKWLEVNNWQINWKFCIETNQRGDRGKANLRWRMNKERFMSMKKLMINWRWHRTVNSC